MEQWVMALVSSLKTFVALWMNSDHFLSSIKSKVEESMWLATLKEKGTRWPYINCLTTAHSITDINYLWKQEYIYIYIYGSLLDICFLDTCRYEPSDGWMDPMVGGKTIPPNNNTCLEWLLAHHHGLELVNLVVDFHMFVKHRLDFSFVFSAPLRTCLEKPVFIKGDLLLWKVRRARLYWDLLTSLKVTSEPVTMSKKWKNPSSALPRKRIWVKALLLYLSCSIYHWGSNKE
jgi:hypothetical protein